MQPCPLCQFTPPMMMGSGLLAASAQPRRIKERHLLAVHDGESPLSGAAGRSSSQAGPVLNRRWEEAAVFCLRLSVRHPPVPSPAQPRLKPAWSCKYSHLALSSLLGMGAEQRKLSGWTVPGPSSTSLHPWQRCPPPERKSPSTLT